MPYFTHKHRGKYTVTRMISGKYTWQVDIPRPVPSAKMDWKRAIYDISARAGYTATLDYNGATLSPARSAGGQSPAEPTAPIVISSNRAGDWRYIFFILIDTIITGATPILTAETPATLFPPVPETPATPGFADGFDPVTLIDQEMKGNQPEWLRVLRSVPYSEAIRLGATDPAVKRSVITAGQTTGLVLLECACGRLIVGSRSLIENTPARTSHSCACRDADSRNAEKLVQRAWREWCTMKLVGSTDCALHKVLEHAGLSTTCDINGPFRDFCLWYTHAAKQAGGAHMLRRLDPAKPFAIDNLQVTKQRALYKDPANPESFKIII